MIEFKQMRKKSVRLNLQDDKGLTLLSSISLYPSQEAAEQAWTQIEGMVVVGSAQYREAHRAMEQAIEERDCIVGERDGARQEAIALADDLAATGDHNERLKRDLRVAMTGTLEGRQATGVEAQRRARLAAWWPRRVWAFVTRQVE